MVLASTFRCRASVIGVQWVWVATPVCRSPPSVLGRPYHYFMFLNPDISVQIQENHLR